MKGVIKRELVDWDAYTSSSVDEPESDLDLKLSSIIDKYVKSSKPKKPGPIVWWNSKCQDAYDVKLKLFNIRFEKPDRYNAAINHCRTVQRRAFAHFQDELRAQLKSMDKSDKTFWRLTKEIGGIEAQRSGAAPSADSLCKDFTTKMSNGKDSEDEDFQPQDDKFIPISNWKIRRKQVLKVLKSVDVSKSANGISPQFWKNTADVVHVAIDKY